MRVAADVARSLAFRALSALEGGEVVLRYPDGRGRGYDDRFLRIWTFYLAYCEAGFAIRSLRDMQIVLTHPANDSLPEFPAVRPTF